MTEEMMRELLRGLIAGALYAKRADPGKVIPLGSRERLMTECVMQARELVSLNAQAWRL